MKNRAIIKICVILVTCFWTPSALWGQSIVPIMYSEMKNEVEKNILIFRIRNSSYFDNIQNEITDEKEPDFLNLIPNIGYRLKLSFSRLDSMKYPLDRYTMYSITNWNYTYVSDSNEITKQYFDRSICCNKYFLVAYDNNSGRVKYVSGQFYKSMISQDFSLNQNDPNSFCQYVTFRLFNLGVSEVKFERKLKSTLVYTGYSSELQSRIKIKVDKSNFEKIQIEQY